MPDVIIIGAGIMGLATAHQLARRSKLDILVLEQGRSLGEGSTGASSAICRHRYSQREMIELARDGIEAYKNWSAFTGLDDPTATFHQDGVLWLNNEGRTWAEQERTRLHSMQVAAEILDQDEVHRRFPALSTCVTPPDVRTGEPHACSDAGHFLFESASGYFEPVDAMHDLARAVKTQGNEVRLNSRAARLLVASGKATGVELESGETIYAGCVVNTSGPWCNDILEPLGLAQRWPLRPTRIQMLHVNRPADVKGKIPVCCDMIGGIYFRQQNRGQQFVLGSAREEDEREVVDPTHYRNWVEDDFKTTQLHALQHRIPGLTDRITVTGYTGLYTVNQADVHPVVGASGLEGFYVANGFSGHGFKLGPAIGSLLAQAITGDRTRFDTGIDPRFLAFDRAPLSVDAMNVMA